VKPRVMFDTGALIALERGQQSIRKTYVAAVDDGYDIVVITPVIAEWWRKGKREKARMKALRSLLVEPPDAYVARLAGEAVGLVGAGVVDALVMARASIHADTVYTSDVDDLERLQAIFPEVEVVHV
jgi:predicted nucleic acid-binding protein